MKGGACIGCSKPIANTAAGAIGVTVGGRVRWAHTGCFAKACAQVDERRPPAAKPVAGKLVYQRRCPRCGKKVKRGTVRAGGGYVWHAIPGREPHLLWMPVNLCAEGTA